jgi:hypothetical protein
MQPDVTTRDARQPDPPQPTRFAIPPPTPQPAPEPTLMEGAVVLVFLALLAVFGVVGALLAH